jgi:hypothetical protein
VNIPGNFVNYHYKSRLVIIVLSKSKKESTECSGKVNAAMEPRTIKKTAQIEKRISFDLSSLTTVFLWLLL